MLLSNRQDSFSIPQTSECIVHTIGTIRDGDTITITSPIFSSINYSSQEIDMSDRFDVLCRVNNETKIVNNDSTINGTLICYDNDIFGMYVQL